MARTNTARRRAHHLVTESVATLGADRAVREASGLLEAPKAGTTDRIPITIIKAGWSLNGRYYPAEVLKRDGAATWPAGTLSFLDHATDQEDAERPAGSVRALAGYLAGDPVWDEAKQALVGELRAYRGPWFEAVLDWAKSGIVGMSIRAWVDAQPGEAEGRKGPVVSRLYGGGSSSVDIVTRAAAGGALGVVESVGKAIAEARNVGHWLESRLHLAFTQLADDMFGNGRLTREERITLSSGVGHALTAFAGHIEAEAPHLYARDIWDYPEDVATVAADEAVLRQPVAEASSEEVRRALTAALREAYQTGRSPAYIWLRDYDAEKATCWYEASTRDSDCTVYEQGYTVGESGRITLAEKRVAVVARTVYDPAPTDASAATVRAGETTSTGAAAPVAEQVQPADGQAAPPNPVEEESRMDPKTPGTTGAGGAGEPARNPHAEALREQQEAQLAATRRADEEAAARRAAELKVAVFEATEAARNQVGEAIAKSGLAKAGVTHPRIVERVVAQREAWLGADGKVDAAKLATAIEATVTAEASYIAQAAEQLYGVGRVQGLGAGQPTAAQSAEAFEAEVEAMYREAGLSESAAKAAAKGR